MGRFAVILAAAGQSTRFNSPGVKKPFASLNGKAVWLHSAHRFVRPDVVQTIIAIAEEDRQEFELQFVADIDALGIEVVVGGETRADTVSRALERLAADVDYVAIHDAARPCVSAEWIDQVFAAAKDRGAAILANPIVGTIKRVTDGVIVGTVPRDGLWEAQTPQVFRRDIICDAYQRRADFQPTDEAQLLEYFGHAVWIVPTSSANLKITSHDDLRLASSLVRTLGT
jgi:2-C-methyl-D-erythritol 4-phosphate cytidylyltransferase